ncbi:hypothetical protein [Micromonospora globbae]|uniref:hypothetical protein n=1 Tax=Micromonospora globbae TaxID=1894969 RepID=UPI0011C423EE|nr:hypothetical protein [Micromonospora globbae]
MSFGYWHREALEALSAATAAMGQRQAITAADINAAVTARSALFTQLARVTELLVGGRPAAEVPNRAGAAAILRRRGQALTQFYVGLRAAAIVDRQFPSAPDAVNTEPARSLRRATDAVGVIGDILASHVPPGRGPRTPEGLAIRAGGGVQSGLAEIARLTVRAAAIDIALPGWIDHGQGHLVEIYRPVAEAARWTAGSGLSAVARDLIAAGRGQPPLDDLDVARSPLNPAPGVSTIGGAITAIAAARTWMWHNPGQLTGAHLRLGTQLGLAVHVLRSGGDPQLVGGWRQAAIAARELRATPPVGPARDAAAELAEALRWLQSQTPAHRGDPATPPDQKFARLDAELPFMAATLHKGLNAALQRRDLFVRAESALRRQTGSLVFRATERWRPAVSDDDVVQDLTRALLQRHDADRHADQSVAARAFPHPLRPRSSTAQASVGSAANARPGRDLRRSR